MSDPIEHPQSGAGPVQPCPNKKSGPCSGQGMSAQAQVDAFSKHLAKLSNQWPKMTPEQRRQRLSAMIDAQAASNGFPAPTLATPSNLGGRNGQLDFQRWRIEINPTLLQKEHLAPEDAAKLGDTLYHETRHAEQWFLMARRQAAEGDSADEIIKQLEVPTKVAKAAASSPLLASDHRRACADTLHRSVYGANRNHRFTTLTNLASQGAQIATANSQYQQAKAISDSLAAQLKAGEQIYQQMKAANPPASPAQLNELVAHYREVRQRLVQAQATMDRAAATVRGLYPTYQKTYADYQGLAEEADAWDVGSRVSAGIEAAVRSSKVQP